MKPNVNSLTGVSWGLLLLWLYVLLPPPSEFPGLNTDSSVYLMMAEFFSGSESEIANGVFRGGLFPPVMPLLISLLENNIVWVHHLVSMFFVLAAVLCFMWFSRIVAGQTACWIVGAAWLSPLLLVFSTEILSEGLFLVWLFLAFRISQLELNRQNALAMGSVLALAILTRTVGIAALPGYAIWLWRGRYSMTRLSQLLSLLFLALPVLFWQGYKYWTQVGGPTQYINAFFDKTISGDGMFIVISKNVLALANVASANGGWVIFTALFILALPTFIERLRRLEFDASFVACYSAIILLWPYPDHMGRFFLIIAPVIVMYSAISIDAVSRSRGWRSSRAQIFTGIAISLFYIPDTARYVRLMQMDVPPELSGYKRNRSTLRAENAESQISLLEKMHYMVSAMRQVSLTVPEGDCIYSVSPDFLMYNSQRISLRTPERVVDLTDCRFVFVCNFELGGLDVKPLFPLNEPEFDGRVPLWYFANEKEELQSALFEISDLREAAGS